jgi:hypothetical protein
MKIVLLLSVISLLMSCSNMMKSGAIVEAQNALNDNHYTNALESIDIAESFGELSKGNSVKLNYIWAQSLDGLGRLGEAIQSYRYIVKHHASSLYAELSQQRLDALNVSSAN